jgi:hypothetical protein
MTTKGVIPTNNLMLTPEMFEASKILAPAMCRGRASLYFDGYGIRTHLQIIGSMRAGKDPHIRIVLNIEHQRTIHQFPLHKYMAMEWVEMKELIREIDQPQWITVKPERS